jgi:diguanylate cyclase (GGDEF)-like protein
MPSCQPAPVLHLLRVLLIVVWQLLAPCAEARPSLALDESSQAVEAWPALTVLVDPTLSMTLAEARARRADFARPEVPEANFGLRREALWLNLPVVVTGARSRWVLELDYPPLNEVDVHVVSEGRVVAHHRLGNSLPFDQRPMRARAHAVTLDLPAGQAHEIFLRVRSSSSLLLPMRLYREDDFRQFESVRELAQGLMIGVTLALLVYSVANAVSLRDPLFWQYALMLLGVTSFFVFYSGIGNQHLWNEQVGLLAKVGPLGILLALAAGSQFVSGALDTASSHPRVARGMQLISALAVLAFVASVAGLLDYRWTQAAATALGPIPIVLALRVAWRRAREGDRIARLMVLGWGAYTVGALSLAGLLRGWLPAEFWLQHLFQLATLVEMLAWVRVLGLRIEGIQRGAERAELERKALHALAHTDPLTGLPNRRGLNTELQVALPQARADHAVALFLLDLDGFKPINDRLGHDAGDELLVLVGRRLKSLLRRGDMVSRIGGDEFVVMSAGLPSEQEAVQLGQKLLAAFREPFLVAGQTCRVGLTIGYALSPQDGRDAGDLLKRADAAMYAGKQAGRHRMQRGGVSTMSLAQS